MMDEGNLDPLRNPPGESQLMEAWLPGVTAWGAPAPCISL